MKEKSERRRQTEVVRPKEGGDDQKGVGDDQKEVGDDQKEVGVDQKGVGGMMMTKKDARARKNRKI